MWRVSGPDGGAAVAAAYKAVALQKQELLEYWSNRDVLRLEILEIHRWADKLHGELGTEILSGPLTKSC